MREPDSQGYLPTVASIPRTPRCSNFIQLDVQVGRRFENPHAAPGLPALADGLLGAPDPSWINALERADGDATVLLEVRKEEVEEQLLVNKL